MGGDLQAADDASSRESTAHSFLIRPAPALAALLPYTPFVLDFGPVMIWAPVAVHC